MTPSRPDPEEKQRHGKGQVFFKDDTMLAGDVDVSRDDKVMSIRHGNSTSVYPMSMVKEIRWKPPEVKWKPQQ